MEDGFGSEQTFPVMELYIKMLQFYLCSPTQLIGIQRKAAGYYALLGVCALMEGIGGSDSKEHFRVT